MARMLGRSKDRWASSRIFQHAGGISWIGGLLIRPRRVRRANRARERDALRRELRNP